MADLYTQIVNAPVANSLASTLGLPVPTPLERYSPGDPVLKGAPWWARPRAGGWAAPPWRCWPQAGVNAATEMDERAARRRGRGRPGRAAVELRGPVGRQVQGAGVRRVGHHAPPSSSSELHRFFHPAIRAVAPNGRVVVLGTPPEDTGSPREHTAQRALEGFTRSLGKEMRGGGTVQLVYVAPGAEKQLDSTLRFLLSPKSAYVSGQVVRIGHGRPAARGQTGTSRWTARWRWSPAPRAASARPSPRCWRATAPTWSAWTSRRWARTCAR